jgi:hypothetical protein
MDPEKLYEGVRYSCMLEANGKLRIFRLVCQEIPSVAEIPESDAREQAYQAIVATLLKRVAV